MDKPFLDKLRKIDPYVPGEQPKTDNIIKLNANENPYPPAPGVTEVLRTFDAAKLAIYPVSYTHLPAGQAIDAVID